jgi:hypothetical protein
MNPILTFLSTAALVGCASAPGKKPLAPEHYREVASLRVLAHKCAVEGKMDLGLAAFGARQVEWVLENRTFYDTAILNDWMGRQSTLAASSENCNWAGLEFHKAKQQNDKNARIAASQIEEQRRLYESNKIPRPIWCNQVGSMTLCN